MAHALPPPPPQAAPGPVAEAVNFSEVTALGVARLSDGANEMAAFASGKMQSAMQAATGVLDNRFQFTAAKQSVRENCGTAVVTVKRTAGSGRSVVHWRTRDGTAKSPKDYEARAGRLVFEKEEDEKESDKQSENSQQGAANKQCL